MTIKITLPPPPATFQRQHPRPLVIWSWGKSATSDRRAAHMCSGSETGSFIRLRLLYHSTLGLRVIKKKKRDTRFDRSTPWGCPIRNQRPTLGLPLYTKVYSVIYDSGSVPDSSIFSPRETSLEKNRAFLQDKVQCPPMLGARRTYRTYRGTSLIRKRPPP